ncbi:hypothetical protein FACS189429_6940 [Bacteroidia bacterium]|nr:hypothetical protein FACS189429_6940 [Bacteroidia bacterium]
MKKIFFISFLLFNILLKGQNSNNIFVCTTEAEEVTPHLSLTPTAVNCSLNLTSENENTNVPYIPTNNSEILTIRVNLHIMQEDDGSGNFPQTQETEQYLADLITGVNFMYANIHPPEWNGETNDPYIRNSKIRFRIDGIYFHRNSAVCHLKPYDESASEDVYFQQYAVNINHSLNVFFANYIYNNGEYAWGGNGFGLNGEARNCVGLYGSSLHTDDFQGLVNMIAHEFGHSLGLKHTQKPDELSDTYPETTQVPCNYHTDVNCSNNLMGPASGATNKGYLSPLQVGKMRKLLTVGWRSKMVDNCLLNEPKVTVTNNQTWNLPHRFSSDVEIANGAVVTMQCKTYLPQQKKFIVNENSKLIIDGGSVSNVCQAPVFIQVNNGGYLEINSGSVLDNCVVEVLNGGSLKLSGNATLQNGSNINFRQGAYFCFLSTAGVNFATDNTALNFHSFVHLRLNPDYYTSSGCQASLSLLSTTGYVNINLSPPDLMIRDDLQDNGTEPNPRAITWNSPDINLKDDYGTLITPCNIPDYKAGTVWVRVWNKSDKTSPSGSKLHVYWATRLLKSRAVDFAAGGIFTSGIFKGLPIGAEITPTGGRILNPISGNSYVDIPVAFNIPDNSPYIERLIKALPNLQLPTISWRFALMAVIDEAGETPITSRLNVPSAALAKQYNNVAVDNGNVIFKSCFSRLITLDELVATPFQFNVGQLLKNDKYLLRDFAELNIILSPDLMSKLIKNNQSADGFKIKDDYTLLITSPNATLRFNAIDNIDAELVAGAEVHFISDKMPELNDFDFDFTIKVSGEEDDITRFTAVRDENVYFKALAEASKTKVVRAKEEVTLTSNQIFDDAYYTWYDEAGEKIGTGYQITITPVVSQKYKIEILKKEDGFKSYDEIEVIVVDGVIAALSPNPAQSHVRVDYKLSDNATNAQIQVSDLQNLMSVSYPVSTMENYKEISLSGFVPGTYFVKLIISGVVVDTQTLIIY